MHSFVSVLAVCARIKEYDEDEITEDSLVQSYLHAPLHTLSAYNCKLATNNN